MESVNVKLEVGLTKRSNEDQQQKLKLQGDILELERGTADTCWAHQSSKRRTQTSVADFTLAISSIGRFKFWVKFSELNRIQFWK